jgi:integrase/recombinase XerD
MLKLAKLENKIQKLPTEGITELRHAYRRKPVLETDQVQTIINKAESLCPKSGKQFSDFVKLCAYSGGRMNEVLSLKWSNVSFDTKLVEFFGKGSKTRHVNFVPKLEAHLKDMFSRKPDSQWLFPSGRKSGARITSFKKTLEKVREETGIEFSNHSFRHYFTSMCVRGGIDFMTIASWLGHADGGVLVGRVYGHLSNQHRIDAASKVTQI